LFFLVSIALNSVTVPYRCSGAPVGNTLKIDIHGASHLKPNFQYRSFLKHSEKLSLSQSRKSETVFGSPRTVVLWLRSQGFSNGFFQIEKLLVVAASCGDSNIKMSKVW